MSFRALSGSPSPWGKPGCGSGWVSANSSNSEPKVTGAERKGNRVTLPQPRVEVRSASTLGANHQQINATL